MMNWRKYLPIVALVAYVALIWIWASSGYPTEGQICQPPNSADNCERHNILFALAWNGATKLDHWSVLITAAATGVIAWFTVSLVRVSNRQAKLTGDSVRIAERTLTELEAPFISIKITDTGVTRSYGKAGHVFQTIWFCVANYGRTPARLIELDDNLSLLENAKEWPSEVAPRAATRNTMPYGVIAPPNGDSQLFSNNLFFVMMDALAADPLPLMTKNLFFYGFVRYSTIFDEVFRIGFCYRFDRYSEKWLLSGDEKYNYSRKERGPLN